MQEHFHKNRQVVGSVTDELAIIFLRLMTLIAGCHGPGFCRCGRFNAISPGRSMFLGDASVVSGMLQG